MHLAAYYIVSQGDTSESHLGKVIAEKCEGEC